MNKTLKIIFVSLLFISLIELAYYLLLSSPNLLTNMILNINKKSGDERINTPEDQAIKQTSIDSLKIFKKGVLNSQLITSEFEGKLSEYSYEDSPPEISLTIEGSNGNQNSFLNIDLDNIPELKIVQENNGKLSPLNYEDINIGDKIILITKTDMLTDSPTWMKGIEIRKIIQ